MIWFIRMGNWFVEKWDFFFEESYGESGNGRKTRRRIEARDSDVVELNPGKIVVMLLGSVNCQCVSKEPPCNCSGNMKAGDSYKNDSNDIQKIKLTSVGGRVKYEIK